MKQMNQILLEGIILNKPEPVPFYSEGCMVFTLGHTKQFTGLDGEKHETLYEFKVLTSGKMAEIVSRKRLGTGVRIVGTLEMTPDGSVIIPADHIDFKPDWKKNNLK